MIYIELKKISLEMFIIQAAMSSDFLVRYENQMLSISQ